MKLEDIREYCSRKKGSSESMPFGEGTLVIKVGNKMYALLAVDSAPLRMNLKCEPFLAMDLREKHKGKVLPGYHMNKLHWNTILLDGTIPGRQIREWIDFSYELVYGSLTKSEKKKIDPMA